MAGPALLAVVVALQDGHGTRTVSAWRLMASGRVPSAAPEAVVTRTTSCPGTLAVAHTAPPVGRFPHRRIDRGGRGGGPEQSQGPQHGLASRRVGGDHHAIARARAQLHGRAPAPRRRARTPRRGEIVVSIDVAGVGRGPEVDEQRQRARAGLEELAHDELARARQRGPVQAGEAVPGRVGAQPAELVTRQRRRCVPDAVGGLAARRDARPGRRSR